MMNAQVHVYICRLEETYQPAIQKAFDWIGLASRLRSGDHVAIKPNLTFPVFRKGVMTNPEALEAVILHLKQFTDRITVCESDSGGYNRFSMDEVFARAGIAELAKRLGVRIVNASHLPARDIHVGHWPRNLRVPLPALLLDETDLLITMPVPKVHLNSIVSIALKNQWGVIHDPAVRLKLHPYFKEVIYQVNKALPKTIAVVDGKYGLTRSGPLKGDVVDLNWIVMSDNIFYTDFIVTDMMGFDYRRIPYLRYAFKKEGIHTLAGVEFNTDYRTFAEHQFYLQRAWTDYPGVFTFNSRVMAYLGYESILAKPMHWLLYKFREPFY
jgi:uncharacterized protein (DUF362 family)